MCGAVHLDVATLGLPYGLGVSLPQTRGYIANGGDSATLWSRPPGEVPTALWPGDRLSVIEPNATGWVVVDELHAGRTWEP